MTNQLVRQGVRYAPILSLTRLCPFPLLCILLVVMLASCGPADGRDSPNETPQPVGDGASDLQPAATLTAALATPETAPVDLTLVEDGVSVAPVPLRAGVPFTITAVIHNNLATPAGDIPLLFYMSAEQEQIGYQPFIHVLTVTVPASQSMEVEVPVSWNFAGGEHQLWVQVNRLPQAWQSRASLHPEDDIADNMALQKLMVDPFDAYTSDLCSGRVDVAIGPADVLPEPDRQRVLVRLHNLGNRAVYNLPVIVLGDLLAGITYTPVIPPCGGTVGVYVGVDRPFQQGEALTVKVNPSDWSGGLQEDDFDNNQVAVSAGLPLGEALPPGSGLADYDFAIRSEELEIPEMWIVLVTVHNEGTRDAAMVPIRIENEAGRKLTDAIPLVQGNGIGVAAVPIGYLWTKGGTLTFTVNPEDAKDGYPETNRSNNMATFVLP